MRFEKASRPLLPPQKVEREKKRKQMKRKDSGLYVLVLRLKRGQTLKAGKLPENHFKAGLYLYVGRAQQGLEKRLERHLRKDKRLFWHIDYFLQKAEVKAIWVKPGFFDECGMVRQIRKLLEKIEIPQRKFGASDCHCPGHLLYLPTSEDKEMKNLINSLMAVVSKSNDKPGAAERGSRFSVDRRKRCAYNDIGNDNHYHIARINPETEPK